MTRAPLHLGQNPILVLVDKIDLYGRHGRRVARFFSFVTAPPNTFCGGYKRLEASRTKQARGQVLKGACDDMNEEAIQRIVDARVNARLQSLISPGSGTSPTREAEGGTEEARVVEHRARIVFEDDHGRLGCLRVRQRRHGRLHHGLGLVCCLLPSARRPCERETRETVPRLVLAPLPQL